MVRFILARLVKAVFILLAILVLNFTLIHAAPGDPAAVMAGEAGASDDKFLEDLRARFGLDQPFHVQLWIYIKGAVQLDLGYSYRRGMPVAELIWDRLPATLLLTATAFFISIIFGVIAGVAAAGRVHLKFLVEVLVEHAEGIGIVLSDPFGVMEDQR